MNDSIPKTRATALLAMGLMLLLSVRLILGERPVNDTGPRAWLDAVFALSLLFLALLIAAGWGYLILRGIKLSGLTPLEVATFSIVIGLGVIAYGVLALGLIGWLTAPAISLWLILSAAVTWRERQWVLGAMPTWSRRAKSAGKALKIWQRLGLLAALCIGMLTLLQALTPPWDYDGLMYHLQGPRLFLQAGRIIVLPDNWQANGPFTIEMLFTVGLALGSATFAKLAHFVFGVLLVLATFNAGQRWLKPNGGWCAAGILIGIPILPIWASRAYADLAWAAYSFLALYAMLVWRDQKRGGLLIAAGLCAGFALGSKYLALGSMGALGLWLVFLSRSDGGRAIVRQTAAFGVTAVLIGMPWYLKNWLLTGNPVYPTYWGGLDWPSARVAALMSYLQSFGAGRQWFDYLLSPINIYAQYWRFVTFQGSIEIPSILFPLALLYPLGRRSPALNILASITLLHYGVWLLGSWQIRFLLPLFPSLSVLAACVILGLVSRAKRLPRGQILAAGLVAGLIVATLVYQLIYFVQTKPLGVTIGTESKAAFLRRNLHDYEALNFIQTKLPAGARVLFLWDSQGYYCEASCWPDTEPSRWTEIFQSTRTVRGMAARLKSLGVTHLMLSNEGGAFSSAHDPTGQTQRAVDFFLRDFQPACAQELYRDQWAAVYELICH